MERHEQQSPQQSRSSVLKTDITIEQQRMSPDLSEITCNEILRQPIAKNNYTLICKNKNQKEMMLNHLKKFEEGGQVEEEDPNQRKKQKRKQYKKRVKLRQREMREQAMRRLEEIIQQMYYQETTFEQSQDIIEDALEYESSTDRFYDFINGVIRDQVDIIRQEIKETLDQYKVIDCVDVIKEVELGVKNNQESVKIDEGNQKINEAINEGNQIINEGNQIIKETINELKINEININKSIDIVQNVVNPLQNQMKKEITVVTDDTKEHNLQVIKRLFDQFQRIKEASPEVQKVINLFITNNSQKNNQALHLQKHLDRLTFKFIIRSDLHYHKKFNALCEYIFKYKNEFVHEQDILKMMVSVLKEAIDVPKRSNLQDKALSNNLSKALEENDSEYEEQEQNQIKKKDKYTNTYEVPKERRYYVHQDDEGSSSFNTYEGSSSFNTYEQQEELISTASEESWNKENLSQNKKGSKKKAKKKGVVQVDQNQNQVEDLICRLQNLTFQEQDRRPCYVEQEWVEKMKRRAQQLIKGKEQEKGKVDQPMRTANE